MDILVRAYDARAKEIYYPTVLTNEAEDSETADVSMDVGYVLYGNELCGSSDDKLMLCTTLKDINGKFIYEEDIVEDITNNKRHVVQFNGVGFEPFIGAMVHKDEVPKRYIVLCNTYTVE